MSCDRVEKRLVQAARRYFGRWTEALVAAGVRERCQFPNAWTADRVLNAIQKRHQRGLPCARWIDVADDPSLRNAAGKFFRTWKNAIRAAGVDKG